MTISIEIGVNASYITHCPTGVFLDSTGLIVGLDCMPIIAGKSLKVL